MLEDPPVRVLAVDDRLANLVALEAILEDLNVQVVRATSGEQALELAQREEFALALLDVSLPGIDGLETAQQLRSREESHHVPIIFLTAFDRVEEQVTRAYALGAVDFLFKPLLTPMLIAKVAVFVELYRKTVAMQKQQELLREAQEREHEQRLSEERARWEAEQLRREVELQRSIATARTQQAVTLHSIGDAVIATDAAQRVTVLNRAAEDLCGWTNEAALGVPLETVIRLLDPETREPVGVVDSARDVLLVARDGAEHLVADSLAPIVDDEGVTQGIVLVLRDVTTQRRLEHALQNSQRLESLGQLAAGIAHDFNNMLGVILASSSLATQSIPDGNPAKELLVDIEDACERATGLTRQLLTFARGGAPVRKLADVASLVTEAVSFSLRGSGTGYDVEIEEGLWPAQLDAGQVTQVLSNLALNARDAMDGKGRIQVEARNVHSEGEELHATPGDYVEIVVRDHGRGIAREHQALVFDPYFSTKPGHHGLGLASAYSVVRRHGGTIKVESAPDEGATFSVYLPATPGAVLGEPAPPSEEYNGTGHVLVMDDEPRLRELLADCLVALHCRVEVAKDGEEALFRFREAMHKDPFDVVILDLTIRGGKGGAETLQELRSLDPEVLAIACSGYANDPIMCAHAQHGFADALEKPFRFAMLARAVRRLIAVRRRAGQRDTQESVAWQARSSVLPG